MRVTGKLTACRITVTFDIPRYISDVGKKRISARSLLHHYYRLLRRIALASRRDVDTIGKSSSTADKSRRRTANCNVQRTLLPGVNQEKEEQRMKERGSFFFHAEA